MTKAELESKHIAELHALAAEADVPRYRMLRREELVEKLLDGKPVQAEREPRGGGSPKRERPPRRSRERSGRERPPRDRPSRDRPPRESAPSESAPTQPPPAAPAPAASAASGDKPTRPRRRRGRRFGRKSKGLSVNDLLMPPPGRQALVYGESRAACTALLREVAGELASKGPDPIALLIDPSPEELAEWKREAPDAEIVAASKARHAGDALAQAKRRAEGGEDVVLLVDSLTRLEDAGTAKEIFDGGLGQANGSLTVVAALERPS